MVLKTKGSSPPMVLTAAIAKIAAIRRARPADLSVRSPPQSVIAAGPASSRTVSQDAGQLRTGSSELAQNEAAGSSTHLPNPALRDLLLPLLRFDGGCAASCSQLLSLLLQGKKLTLFHGGLVTRASGSNFELEALG